MSIYTQNTQTFYPNSSFNINSSFTLQTGLGVNATMNVYQQAYAFLNTNYIIFMNVNSISSMFTNASYNDYLNSVNVNMTLNTAYVTNLLNTNIASVMYRGLNGASDSVCGFEKLTYNTGTSRYVSTSQTLGYRLLELSANRIFGNAKARAAISNDTDFIYGTVPNAADSNTALYNSLSSQLSTAFNTDKAAFFNQYVNSARYTNSVDSNQWQNFNLTGANIQVMLTVNVATSGSYAGTPTSFSNQRILLMLTESYTFNDVSNAYTPGAGNQDVTGAGGSN